jgi:hypothetical protein
MVGAALWLPLSFRLGFPIERIVSHRFEYLYDK